MLRLGSLLWHHIHVCLQDDALTIFHSRACGLAHYDVACQVLEYLYASFCAEVEQELLDFVEVTTWAWHLCECEEILPDALGL